MPATTSNADLGQAQLARSASTNSTATPASAARLRAFSRAIGQPDAVAALAVGDGEGALAALQAMKLGRQEYVGRGAEHIAGRREARVPAFERVGHGHRSRPRCECGDRAILAAPASADKLRRLLRRAYSAALDTFARGTW
jgi:hypothetical protein